MALILVAFIVWLAANNRLTMYAEFATTRNQAPPPSKSK